MTGSGAKATPGRRMKAFLERIHLAMGPRGWTPGDPGMDVAQHDSATSKFDFETQIDQWCFNDVSWSSPSFPLKNAINRLVGRGAHFALGLCESQCIFPSRFSKVLQHQIALSQKKRNRSPIYGNLNGENGHLDVLWFSHPISTNHSKCIVGNRAFHSFPICRCAGTTLGWPNEALWMEALLYEFSSSRGSLN